MNLPSAVSPIQLTHEHVAFVDVEDVPRIAALRWSVVFDETRVYARAIIEGKPTFMHRFILGLEDRNVKVDHWDGNGLHNWKSNLRRVTNAQNIRNQRPHSDKRTSKFKGVYFASGRGKFSAQIQVDRKKINLGAFADEMDAARAYDAAAVKYFGEFARINFEPEATCAE